MTPAQLQEYGFPEAPPSNSPTYQSWYDAMSNAGYSSSGPFACGDFTAGLVQPADPGSSNDTVPTDSNSYNWSGYQSNQAPFYGVQGTWNVPSVKAVDPTTDRYESSWVGAGTGCSKDPCSNELVQAGTGITTTTSGSISVYSWYEIYPMIQPSVIVSGVPVKQGDTYFVNLNVGTSSVNFYLEDETNGHYASFSVAFKSGDACSCNSAEAIEEAPTVNGSIAQLPPLTNENFNSVAPVTSNGNQWLGSLSHFGWTMISPYTGDVLASPGSINNGNFSVVQTNPNFSIGANPSTIDVLPGLSGSSTITVTGTKDWPQRISFSTSGAPSGNSASVSPNPITIGAQQSGSTTLTVTRGATYLSTFSVTVTGSSSGGAAHSTTVTVGV